MSPLPPRVSGTGPTRPVRQGSLPRHVVLRGGQLLPRRRDRDKLPFISPEVEGRGRKVSTVRGHPFVIAEQGEPLLCQTLYPALY